MAKRNKSNLVVRVLLIMMILSIMVLAVAAIARAADCNLGWKAATGATGYRIEYSINQGTAWTGAKDTGPCTPDAANECHYVYTGVPETGLILFRISSLGAGGAVVTRLEAGAWFNQLWKPPTAPGGAGIQ